MQYYLLGLISIPFLYINYKIIKTDLGQKIIPNKYLLFLIYILPIYYLYNYYFFDINYLFFGIQIILTLFISFILYYFGIWSAGDAKYLLVLSLFIPHIGIIPLIGNIALLTIIYLLIYFIWFYLGKCIFYKGYLKSLISEIKTDLKGKWIIYKKNKGGRNLSLVLKWIVTFLIIFVSIRILRIYLFKDVFENKESSEKMINIIENYHIYLLILFIGIFVGTIFLIKLIYKKIKEKIIKKYQINSDKIDTYFMSIIFILLIIFLTYEFLIDSSFLIKNLKIIFTLYIILFILLVILKYSYKIVFQISETNVININQLKKGDIIDKEYIINMFSEQVSLLKFLGTDSNKKLNEIITNPIDDEGIKNIKKIYSITNNYHKINNTEGFDTSNKIKTLQTFAFAGYIFSGFIITFLVDNMVFKLIIEKIIYLVKYFY